MLGHHGQQGDELDIRGLGYIGLDVAAVDAWRVYAGALGAMVRDADGDESFGIKVDDRPYRVLVQPTEGEEGLAFAGWELPDETALRGVDDASWIVTEITKPSFWGHRPPTMAGD